MYVLDASALAKAFLEEAGSKEFQEWLAHATLKGIPLRAPHIAFSEIGRVIQKECRDLAPVESKELHEAVFLGVEVMPLSLEGTAWDLANRLSYYDAEYVAAAKESGSTLVSADDRQLQAAARLGIKTLSFSPAEGRAKPPDAA